MEPQKWFCLNRVAALLWHGSLFSLRLPSTRGRFPQASERNLLTMDSMESPTSHGKAKSMVKQILPFPNIVGKPLHPFHPFKTHPFIVAGKDRMWNCHFLNLHRRWLQGQYRVLWTYNFSGAANKPKRNNLNETPESCKEVLCVLNYTVLANVVPISGDPSPPCH